MGRRVEIALGIVVGALLLWNVSLLSQYVDPARASAVEMQTLRGAPLPLVPLSLPLPADADTAAAQPQPRLEQSKLVTELRALHSWARVLSISNRRMLKAVQDTLLPKATSKEARAIFRPLLHIAEATLRSSISVDLQVGDALSLKKPSAVFQTMHPRIFCAIPTAWPRDEYRFNALEETWTKHCDVIKFVVGTKTYEKYNLATHKYAAKFLHVPVTRTEDPKVRNIWEKSWRMWKLISHEYVESCDFFIKTDTDAFVMVENLRAYLRHYDAETKHYMGHTMLQRWGTENVKFNIGAGYVLSRASVRALGATFDSMPLNIDQVVGKMSCVDREGAGEDPTMSICLRDIGVLADNTQDSRGRHRFHPFRVVDHLNTPRVHEDWYWSSKTRDTGVERTCCAAFPIMFHNYKDHGIAFMRGYEELECVPLVAARARRPRAAAAVQRNAYSVRVCICTHSFLSLSFLFAPPSLARSLAGSYWFHESVGGRDAFRYSEPPDQGLFRYDPDSIRFTIDPRHNSIRDACGIGGGPTCRGELPVLGNRPRSKDLATAFAYTHEGAGGTTTKPCVDTFCRDQKVDSSGSAKGKRV
jgi:glycoprotein-N-acetylgalactosamine 3-beta-galactosyltransferase